MSAKKRFRGYYECDTDSDRDLAWPIDSIIYVIDSGLYYKINSTSTDFVLVDPDDIILVSPIDISKLNISGVPDGSQFLRDDGAWAVPEGVKGTQGTQGSIGPTGSTGAQGTQGSQGSQGTIGTTGSQGVTGPQGTQGSIGLQGSQGTQGSQGSLGPTGPQGATGPTGSGTPGGSDTQVQFNDTGAFGGDADWTYNKTTNIQTIKGGIIVIDETASRIASYDGSKQIKALDTATYPSLTELSYVKGVTSALQTQLDGKYSLSIGGTATGTNTFAFGTNPWLITSGVTTGTGSTAGINPVFNSLTSGYGWDNSTNSYTSGALAKFTSTSTTTDNTLGTNITTIINGSVVPTALTQVRMSGTNSTSGKTAIGFSSIVSNSGTSSTNVGGFFSAYGATTNYAIYSAGTLAFAANVATNILGGGTDLTISAGSGNGIGVIINGSSPTSGSNVGGPVTVNGGAGVGNGGGGDVTIKGGAGAGVGAGGSVIIKVNSTTTAATFNYLGNTTFTQASQSSTNTFQTFTQAAHTGGTSTGLTWTGGAHTSQATTVEVTDWNLNFARVVKIVDGTTATQRTVRIQAPTFTPQTTALTLTDAATLEVGTITAGSGTTITRNWNTRFIGTGYVGHGGNAYFGGTATAPTALIHIAAGTATANTAPLQFTAGTNETTARAGVMEYDGTNLFFTRTGTTRGTLIQSDAVNSVSPTSPDRTITVNIGGTTYYIAAKTTND